MASYKDISLEQQEVILKHYLRPEIQKIMIRDAIDKEVVGSFKGTGYAKRPDVLEYENDISIFVKKGITSFHVSVENWHNPLELKPGLSKSQLIPLRKSWDLLIDIDCPHWGISKFITHLLVQELESHGISNVSVKFSGNKGFHIGVPSESFSASYEDEFPELPRQIAQYLLHKIFGKAQEEVVRILLAEFGSLYNDAIEKLFSKTQEELIVNGKLDPYKIIEIDTVLLSQRHLYRMSYSVNEKSLLVSIPINPKKILQFEKRFAKLPCPISKFSFMDRSKSVKGEADALCNAVRDFSSLKKEEEDILQQIQTKDDESHKKKTFEELKDPIPETCFSDAIKKLLEGKLQDGKKRALFVLLHFLSSVGWSYDSIEKRLREWNETHIDPIRETIFQSQLAYLKDKIKRNAVPLPPNFENASYYLDIIGQMDEYRKAKNPVSISKKRFSSYKLHLKKESLALKKKVKEEHLKKKKQ